MARLVVSITHAVDDPERATVGFVIACAALTNGVETLVFLSNDGAWLSKAGHADLIAEPGLPPLAELFESFLAGGGTIWVCGSCFRKRNLVEAELASGASIVGGASLVEFLSQDTSGSLDNGVANTSKWWYNVTIFTQEVVHEPQTT